MLELPEVTTLATQINMTLAGKRIRRVRPPVKAGRFCFFNGDPAEYADKLCGRTLTGAVGFGIFAEMTFNDGRRLAVNDGVKLTWYPSGYIPNNYQLLMEFESGGNLAFSIVMYGGIYLHDGDFDNAYYIKSLNAIDVFAKPFSDYFMSLFDEAAPTLSAKGLLATEQRIPGLGNGVLQDVLFNAGMTPRRKVAQLTKTERDTLLWSVTKTLGDMISMGGRDTEMDLYGNAGGYKTLMSRNRECCPRCKWPITRENYMGGSVYYCPVCQK